MSPIKKTKRKKYKSVHKLPLKKKKKWGTPSKSKTEANILKHNLGIKRNRDNTSQKALNLNVKLGKETGGGPSKGREKRSLCGKHGDSKVHWKRIRDKTKIYYGREKNLQPQGGGEGGGKGLHVGRG